MEVMTDQLNKEADEVKRLNVKLEKDAENMKKLKEKVEVLERESGPRHYAIAARAMGIENEYKSALADFGATPKPLTGSPSIGDEEFFGWLNYEFKVLPKLLTLCSDYGVVVATEAAFNLLERTGCNHFTAFCDGHARIDDKARTDCSQAVTSSSRNFYQRYWVKHGRGEAKEKARALLVNFCFSLNLQFLLNFLINLSLKL